MKCFINKEKGWALYQEQPPEQEGYVEVKAEEFEHFTSHTHGDDHDDVHIDPILPPIAAFNSLRKEK